MPAVAAFRPFAPALALAVAFFAPSTASAALPPEKRADLPPAAATRVDFVRDIQPIFEASCVQCHARGKAKGSFSLETRADFLTGGDTGTAAVPGRSADSLVVEMISGLSADSVMPKKGKKLTREQVALVRAWIDQGLPWPKEIAFTKHEPANLRSAAVSLPPAKSGLEHPLDRLVDGYFAARGITWPQPVDDRRFARRVWLDTIGLLPPPGELDAFLADPAPDKRARLVERLLADNQRYAEHWLTFWNDLLRNDYKGTGYIDGGRRQITSWLYRALARNLPYDQFVAQLIDPGAEAEGFTKGILWRGAVNASMVPPMQASQSIAQVFLGVNLKCASCHDSFINEYTLADSYGLASIYADGPLEIAECDKPTGHIARVKFLYEELGGIDAKAPAAARKQQLAALIAGRTNGRLPRTIVNRVWQRFMGYGLVEPVDEMDKPAWSPAVMDWLAEDLAAHQYNLKHTMARILTSRTYQLPAVNLGETEDHYVFRGPAIRRLSAEQFADGIMAIAEQTYPKADAKLNRAASLHPATTLPLQPKWIWNTPGAEVKAKAATVVFRRTLMLEQLPNEATGAVAGDDSYTLKVNGRTLSTGRRNATTTDFVDLAGALKVGENTLEITAVNQPPDNGRTPPAERTREAETPAGVILYARIRAGSTVLDIVSDASWTATEGKAEPVAAVELGGVDLAPWRLGEGFLEIAAATKDTLPVQRAALVAADPLLSALGRPNREQVVTVRQGTATTLQALELTNGSTLATALQSAAKSILARPVPSTDELVASLYVRSVSRPPTAPELAAATRVVGSPATADGIEDLLWALTMLPEFQLIR